MDRNLRVVLALPEEAELPLLEELSARNDTEIIAVVDPLSGALGGALAEVMGLPVVASLEAVGPLDGVVCAMPSQPSAAANDVAAAAEARGLEVEAASVLLRRLRLNQPARRLPGPPVSERKDLEREAGAVERSLAALEDALAGDAILQRVLELATRAVGATSGSLMLYDEPSRELYIAYAAGLSEATLHRTRMRLGEGIAGRVARDRRPELVEGLQGDADERDRPDIASAVSAPLVWDERLLGVINVSTVQGTPRLGERERDRLADLAGRLGRILDRVLNLQESRTGQIVRLTESRLRQLRAEVTELPDLLANWAGAVAVAAAAEVVTIAIPCQDGGSLLIGEATADGAGRHRHEPHENPAWIDVLGTAAPVVVRQEEGPAPLTAFFLPVGREPVIAGLGVQFRHGGPAHAFHGLASELVNLLERLLSDELERHLGGRQQSRLADLSRTLAAVAGADVSFGERAERLCAEAARLTGAREAVVVASFEDDEIRLAAGNATEGADWLERSPRWLRDAAGDGWRITTLAAEPGSSLSVLVVCAGPGRTVPGLILVGKERRDPLEGDTFGADDLELTRPIVRLLATLPPPGRLESEPLALSLPVSGRENLLVELEREMDRCERYHTQLGLLVLGSGHEDRSPSGDAMAAHLRSSDRIFTLPGGVLAVLVPEDVLSLDRLRRRLVDAWVDLTGGSAESVTTARAIFPGRQRTPESLLDHVLEGLRATR